MYVTSCCLVLLLAGINGQIIPGALPPKAEGLAGSNDNWFNQTLDHFSNDEPTYWNQRYFVSDVAWKKMSDSPVFLMVGGESPISQNWMIGGAWVVWAYKYGSLLFQLEHRFYGKSHPTADTSVDNLQYLTTDQAISDIANFIQQMNTMYNLTSSNKWILFGGSYPGNLAAWARLKQPDLVYGAVSSSGPLEAKVDFFEYYDGIRSALETVSPGCGTQVANAVKSIQTTMNTTGGPQQIQKKLNVCGGWIPQIPQDVNMLYQFILSPITSAVQYNNIAGPQDKITFVCGYMNDASVKDPADRLAALLKKTSTQCLFASYYGNTAYYQNTGWNDGAVSRSKRQWLYQCCKQLGYFQTSSKTSSLLGNTLPESYFTQQCTDIFGMDFNSDQVNEAVDYTNNNYGGWNIKVDRVVFVQGSLDPWHPLGMVKTVNPKSPLVYIQGTTHMQDQITPQDSDSTALKNGRAKIEKSLDSWLLS